MSWLYCVEMTIPDDSRARWQVMYGRCGVLCLVDIERDEAVERASKLSRHGGRFAYRVRRLVKGK